MNPLTYLKAIAAGVGATAFPPIFDWVFSFVPAPPDVRMALSILVVAALTGTAVYKTNNLESGNAVTKPLG